jgi:hypothetical protein
MIYMFDHPGEEATPAGSAMFPPDGLKYPGFLQESS